MECILDLSKKLFSKPAYSIGSPLPEIRREVHNWLLIVYLVREREKDFLLFSNSSWSITWWNYLWNSVWLWFSIMVLNIVTATVSRLLLSNDSPWWILSNSLENSELTNIIPHCMMNSLYFTGDSTHLSGRMILRLKWLT